MSTRNIRQSPAAAKATADLLDAALAYGHARWAFSVANERTEALSRAMTRLHEAAYRYAEAVAEMGGDA